MHLCSLFTSRLMTGLAIVTMITSAIALAQVKVTPQFSLGCLPTDLELPQEPPAPTPST